MPEIKIFVDIKEDSTNSVIISPSNAAKLGISTGMKVEVFNPENGKNTIANLMVSDSALEFAGQISKNIIDIIEFAGIEVILKTSTAGGPVSPTPQVSQKLQTPQPHLPGSSSKPVQPYIAPHISPTPQLTPTPQRPPTLSHAPQISPTPQYSSTPQPTQMPIPTSMPTTQPPGSYAPSSTVSTFPNKIAANTLASQRQGIILTPVVDNTIIGGRVQLSGNTLNRLGLGQGMLVGWEDPWTRVVGSARVDQAPINDNMIKISKDTKEDTNIQADQIVVYSTEPPIHRASEIMLQVQSQPNLEGFCLVSPRIQHTLAIQFDDVLAFEDELTGATGAAKIRVTENVPDNALVIDSEILEASGIGSFEVKVSKNQRQIIPLQSVSLGVNPISGENMWEIMSNARQNVNALKNWLSNYVIFKGIKLRWQAVNIACSILSTVPDLTGDILAQITPNTTVTLAPTGLIPFNAILILDISRSMMARDVLVTNIAPAIEGIKAAMESREIQEFLKHFKDGVNVPRRISAAFAAVLFLSEKVGRGFGEKVSVIRFADEAQILPIGESFYMDSASGKKGVLEDAARIIVDRIASSYGQATNMGSAMVQAKHVLSEFDRLSPNSPNMVVILTDGVPTDGDAFFNQIQQFSTMPNVIVYIVGLGNPDDELMTRAASLCGGEYFKPENAGDLLVWYSKRARDLTVKLKAHRV